MSHVSGSQCTQTPTTTCPGQEKQGCKGPPAPPAPRMIPHHIRITAFKFELGHRATVASDTHPVSAVCGRALAKHLNQNAQDPPHPTKRCCTVSAAHTAAGLNELRKHPAALLNDSYTHAVHLQLCTVLICKPHRPLQLLNAFGAEPPATF